MSEDDNKPALGQPPKLPQKASSSTPPPPPPMMRTESIEHTDEPLRAFVLDSDD